MQQIVKIMQEVNEINSFHCVIKLTVNLILKNLRKKLVTTGNLIGDGKNNYQNQTSYVLRF